MSINKIWGITNWSYETRWVRKKNQGRNKCAYSITSKKKYMETKNKKSKKQIALEKKIAKIYELYPEPTREVKNWNKGGFVNDEKYKQPIKHKKYK